MSVRRNIIQTWVLVVGKRSVEVLDVLEAGYKRALDLTFDVLTTPERLAVLERFEGFRRQQPAIEHALINQLAAQASPSELGWQAGAGVG